MKKKTLLLVNQSAGYLMEDICQAFLDSGRYDQVALATGSPENIRISDPRFKIEHISKYDRRSLVRRTLSWVKGFFQALSLAWTRYAGSDLFLVSNPPTVSFLPWFCRNRYSVLIYDVYPDGLIGGYLKPSHPIIKIWVKANRRFYKKAQHIYTITSGMADSISKYADADRIEVVPLWYNKDIRQIPKDENPFVERHGLKDKFVVMFSGNMGKGARLENLIDIAERLKDDPRIAFVLIGGGMMKKDLERQKIEKGLDNMLILPYQPLDEISSSFSAADMFYIAIGGESAKVCIPSKSYNSFAVGTPILSFTDRDSALWNLIVDNGIGFVYDFGDTAVVAEDLKKMVSESKVSTIKEKIEESKVKFSFENARRFTV